MSVNADQVRHVARLARLALSDDEIDRMVPELNNILGWVEQLGEVDTDGVEPLTAVIENQLRLRDDRVDDGNIRDDVLKNAPDAHLIILLVDERPEEVTDFARMIPEGKREIISSTFDEPAARHLHVAEVVMQKAKCLVEAGEHVFQLFFLVDDGDQQVHGRPLFRDGRMGSCGQSCAAHGCKQAAAGRFGGSGTPDAGVFDAECCLLSKGSVIRCARKHLRAPVRAGGLRAFHSLWTGRRDDR